MRVKPSLSFIQCVVSLFKMKNKYSMSLFDDIIFPKSCENFGNLANFHMEGCS